MATEIKVPTLGESITEATVAKWLKAVGDTVKVDDPLVELETDKVTAEVNATVAGVLSEIIAQAGAEVAIGSVLGSITEGAVGAAPKPAAAPVAAPVAAAPAPVVAAAPTPGVARRAGCRGRARGAHPPDPSSDTPRGYAGSCAAGARSSPDSSA